MLTPALLVIVHTYKNHWCYCSLHRLPPDKGEDRKRGNEREKALFVFTSTTKLKLLRRTCDAVLYTHRRSYLGANDGEMMHIVCIQTTINRNVAGEGAHIEKNMGGSWPPGICNDATQSQALSTDEYAKEIIPEHPYTENHGVPTLLVRYIKNRRRVFFP